MKPAANKSNATLPMVQVEEVSKAFRVNQRGTLTVGEVVREGLSRVMRPESRIDEQTFWALKDVSFSIEQGSSLGIIGENGAGKSTLLRIISGLTMPTSGRVVLQGHIASILDIGTGFHPELSGRENVYFSGQIRGYSKADIKSRYDKIVQFSGIEEFIDTSVKYYSSGMFLRLAFSVLVHLDREIIAFDEVLTVGDDSFRRQCSNKIIELRNQGRTFIIASHNPNDIVEYCDKVLLLESGKVKENAEPMEVLRGYQKEKEPEVVDSNSPQSSEQDSYVEIISIESHKEDGTPSTSFGDQEPIVIRLKYKLLAENLGIDIALVLRDLVRARLFAESTKDLSESFKNERGEYIVEWTIPKGLLGGGTFYIELVTLFSLQDMASHSIIYQFDVEAFIPTLQGRQFPFPLQSPGTMTCKRIN